MFSTQMGLPPRFAGVALLALGNGAADVSATINAIVSDPENGYKMSLGALTGAAMFITTCIVGAVVVVNDGVKCRGAAVRDVMALAITLLVVGVNLGSGEVDKKVGLINVWCYMTSWLHCALRSLTQVCHYFQSETKHRHPKHSFQSTSPLC
jgi:Ca2+/Na+ antiporter